MTEGRPATAIFFCGLACSGKSTLARFLEDELPARRFSVDEHVGTKHRVGPLDEAFGDLARQARERFWRIGARRLRRGEHVLFDWSLWSRARRAEWTSRAKQAGHPHRILYFDVPLAVLKRRLEARNRERPEWAVSIPIFELERFAGFFEAPEADEGLEVLRITPQDSFAAIAARFV